MRVSFCICLFLLFVLCEKWYIFCYNLSKVTINAQPHSNQHVPKSPGDLKPVWEEYTHNVNKVSNALMRCFAHALDLKDDFFVSKTENHVSLLKANHYPVVADEVVEVIWVFGVFVLFVFLLKFAYVNYISTPILIITLPTTQKISSGNETMVITKYLNQIPSYTILSDERTDTSLFSLYNLKYHGDHTMHMQVHQPAGNECSSPSSDGFCNVETEDDDMVLVIGKLLEVWTDGAFQSTRYRFVSGDTKDIFGNVFLFLADKA